MTTLVPITLALLVSAATAEPEERRFALLVGNPTGGEDLMPLRYTDNDVERVREVLELVGGFAEDDVVVKNAEDAGAVLAELERIKARIDTHRARSGQPTLFLFYYSGHAKDGELRLGSSRLPLVDVKRRIEQTGAGLRIALLDACRSGSITRMKGASKGDAINMAVDEASLQAGQVLITASSENEDAQESDDIQGSFFTHYMTSGLRGAADENRDGKVTLSEAYAFAYASTVSRTVATKGGIQHPTYRFDLRGAGDVVLTRHELPPSTIAFPADAAGLFVVFDTERRVVVAEFEKQAGQPLRVAVAPGDYVVKKREPDHLRLQRVSVSHLGTADVELATMEKVAFADDYAKGATISTEEILYGKLGVRLSALIGGQTFLSAPIREAYVPSMSMLQVHLDFDNLVRRNLGLRLDVGVAGAKQSAIGFNDRYLGELNYEVHVGELTAGASLVWTLPLADWFDLGVSGRLGFITVTREFLHGELPNQSFATLAPGLGASASVHVLDWLRVGAGVGMNYMFFKMDESRSLAYLDGGVTVTAVLK